MFNLSVILCAYIHLFNKVVLAHAMTAILTCNIDIAILSVRPLCSGILWKRRNVLSWFLHHSVAQSF